MSMVPTTMFARGPRGAALVVLVALGGLCMVPGCDGGMCDEPGCDSSADCDQRGRRCADDPHCVVGRGEAYLLSRSAFDDYEAATFSFEHAAWQDSAAIRNDWDVLFGNDRNDALDELRVNTVTDDRSHIVDLGMLPLSDVPQTLELALSAPGAVGGSDPVIVHFGHVYLVRTLDPDTAQYAAFRVVDHQLNESITVVWYRSPDPHRFTFP